MAKPYTARSIQGAQAEVRQLRKDYNGLASSYHKMLRERAILAKLAADGPAFYNPLHIIEAKQIRDKVLATWCNLNPDGSPLQQ